MNPFGKCEEMTLPLAAPFSRVLVHEVCNAEGYIPVLAWQDTECGGSLTSASTDPTLVGQM